jgi:hypothetical protein
MLFLFLIILNYTVIHHPDFPPILPLTRRNRSSVQTDKESTEIYQGKFNMRRWFSKTTKELFRAAVNKIIARMIANIQNEKVLKEEVTILRY